MKALTLISAILAAVPWTLAQQEQQDGQNEITADRSTSTLTMLDASGSTLIATVTLVDSVASSYPSTTHAPRTAQQSSPETSETSVIQATRTESVYYPSASSSTNLNADGIDVEGGASGSSSGGGFSLSQGGMIAVIVVVVCVAVFGVLSITFFILAKKRQWRVRESIKRASRRLTGRADGPRPRSEVDRRKRSGVIAGAGGQRSQRVPPSTPLVQQKGTAVSETEMRDLEKGEGGQKGGNESGWLGKMKGNDWR